MMLCNMNNKRSVYNFLTTDTLWIVADKWDGKKFVAIVVLRWIKKILKNWERKICEKLSVKGSRLLIKNEPFESRKNNHAH